MEIEITIGGPARAACPEPSALRRLPALRSSEIASRNRAKRPNLLAYRRFRRICFIAAVKGPVSDGLEFGNESRLALGSAVALSEARRIPLDSRIAHSNAIAEPERCARASRRKAQGAAFAVAAVNLAAAEGLIRASKARVSGSAKMISGVSPLERCRPTM